MNRFNFAFWTWFGIKSDLRYPNDFAIIDYSAVAKELGVRGDRNKVITRFFMNRFNNLEARKYRYSEARVFTLQEIQKVPIYDKTKEKPRFPVFSRVLPGEVQFLTK